MEQSKQDEVNRRFESGTKNITEEDLSSVMGKKEKAFELSRHLGKFCSDFQVLWGLLQDYRAGTYREIPWKVIAAVVFAMAYLIMPIDVIPDFIPIAGFADDISVFGLVLAGFASELNAYKEWKQAQGNKQITAKETQEEKQK